MREALTWSAVWVSLAIASASVVWATMGSADGAGVLAGYLVEEALSVDNLFVFILIFGFFRCRPRCSTGCCSGASWARWSCAAS